jgi:hypothetical protein
VRREWWSLQEARARIYRGFEAQSRRRKRWTEGNATRTSRQSQRSRRSYRTMVTMWMRSDAPRRGSRRIGPWGRLAPCSHIESSDEASTYEAALGTVLRWHWTFELSYMCTSSLPSLIASAALTSLLKASASAAHEPRAHAGAHHPQQPTPRSLRLLAPRLNAVELQSEMTQA